MAKATLEERFWVKVDKHGPSGCWLWTASKRPNGYGQFSMGGHRAKIEYAHRVAYRLLVGPIPEGLELDHLCRVPACVRPSHLEPVTRKENLRRGLNGVLKTHCINGHPFDEANTWRWRGERICRTCKRNRRRH